MPNRSSPEVCAKRYASSRDRTQPSNETRTFSSKERTAADTFWRTSSQEAPCPVCRLHQLKPSITSLLAEVRGLKRRAGLQANYRPKPERLAEQVLRRRAHDLTRTALPAAIAITTNYTSGNECVFPANQTGHTRQFIGNTLFRGVHLIAIRIAMAAIVANRIHAGDADGNLVQAFAPCPTEAVGDDDRDMQRRTLADPLQNLAGRTIGIDRQE